MPLDADRAPGRFSPRPGDVSPSFAQTGTDFFLDDDSDDASEVDVGGYFDDVQSVLDGEDTYELVVTKRNVARDRSRRRGSDGVVVRTSRRQRQPPAATSELYTAAEELAVRTKFDRKLVLFLALLFMLSFLDRSNIGNARIAGMDRDLQTSPPRDDWYEWCLTAFYLSYIAFEWLSLLWRVVPAHVLVSGIVLTWGLAASLQSVATSYPVLVALRVLLGIGEAGFTGVPLYLSFFYRREELAFRTAIFISAAPLATSFAATLAWLIVKFASFGPIAPWRLLFLLEGFPSVVVSVVAWSVIPDSPQTARYLTAREREVAMLRLGGQKPSSRLMSGLCRRDLVAVVRDPVVWLPAAILFLANMAYSSLPVFLPKMVAEMGYGAAAAQALAAPPYLVAFVLVLFTAHMSDRLRSRAAPLIFHALASAFGYALLALADALALPPLLRYLALYPAAVGFYNVVTLVVAWSINNQANHTRQGAGFALLQLVGQCGPLVGTRLYPDRDGPYYVRGMGACACAMFAVAALALALRLLLRRRNDRMDRVEGEKWANGSTVEEQGLVSSGTLKRAPADSFRYIL